jgi:hypothetical protein
MTGRVVAENGTPAQLATRLLSMLSEAELMRQSRETFAVLALESDPRRDPKALSQISFNSGIMTGAHYQYGTLDLDHDRYTIGRLPPDARYIAFMARDELLGVAEIAKGGAGPDVPIDLALLPESPLVRVVHFSATSALDGKPLDMVQIQIAAYPGSTASYRQVQFVSEPDEQRLNPPLVHELALPVGSIVISTYRTGWTDDHLSAEIPPGDEPLELTLALVPSGKASIRGEIVDADGKPVADAALRLYRKSDMKPVWGRGMQMPGKSDASGRFELPKLPAVDYVLAAERSNDDDRDLAPAAIVVAAKEPPEPCRLVLSRAVMCSLDVSFIDGVSRGFRLRALNSDGIPLIDDLERGLNDFWRRVGRVDLALPKSPTTLEFLGPKGVVKSILFDPSLSTSASVILPAN